MGCEGRIQKALSGFYYVNTGAEVLTCRARGKFRKEGVSPLVGDRVEVRELGSGEGVVEAILPRKNHRRPEGLRCGGAAEQVRSGQRRRAV